MKKKHIGSNFDEFLKEESLLEHSTAIAVKRVIAWHTSRAALNRLLDESDTSLTLITLASAATVLGKIIKFELKAA